MDIIRNIMIVVETTGRRIGILQIAASYTTQELLLAVCSKINLPTGTRGVLIRKLTRKQLLPHQSLANAGVESGEILIADFERPAGGSFEFYPDGKLKKIETEPEETPYLAEILREIHRLQKDMATLNDRVADISAEIKEIRNSTIVISGNNATVEKIAASPTQESDK